MKYSKQKLKNGLTIIQVPSSDAESVVVDFFVKTGSRSETEKENGISHFFFFFLFKGTKKYPNALAISTLVDSIGGEMNANTGKEHTQFYIKAASQHLPLIFEVLTDMIQNPLLDEVELEKEKGVIVEEINMYKDAPMYEVDNILEGAMWPQDPLGRDIAGTKDTVTKFNPQMFRDYMNRHYQTTNMLLGISGKYDQKKLNALISKYWLKYPKAKAGGWQKVKDGQNTPRLKLEFKQTEQAHLAFGFKGLSYSDKRLAVQSVLSAVLSGGMSGRLFMEVREKRGLAYYVRASGGAYQDTGGYSINAGVQVGKIEEAITTILQVLEYIKNTKVGAEELSKAKEYIKGKTALALEDNQVRLDWFLEREAFYPKILTPKEALKKIEAVTAADVQKLAKKLFNMNKLSLAIIGPYKDEKVFQALLKI